MNFRQKNHESEEQAHLRHISHNIYLLAKCIVNVVNADNADIVIAFFFQLMSITPFAYILSHQMLIF